MMATEPSKRRGFPSKRRQVPRIPDIENPPPTARRRTMPKLGRTSFGETLDALSKLHQRDRNLLTWLFRQRFATTDQIHRRWFVEPGIPAKKSKQNARRRLWELANQGLIAGLVYQQRSRAWTLDRMGLAGAQQLLRISPSKRTPPEQWSLEGAQVNHYVAITEVYLRLYEAITRALPAGAHISLYFQWSTKTRLAWKAEHPPGTSNTTYKEADLKYLFPDAVILLRLNPSSSWITIYVEVDLNSEDPSVILEKCERYIGSFVLPMKINPWGEDVPDLAPRDDRYVLFIAEDRGRADRIQATMDQTRLPGLSVHLDDMTGVIFSMEELVVKRLTPLLQQDEEERRKREAESGPWGRSYR